MATSVTTERPRVVKTALGTFRYRHIQRRLFWGYEAVMHQAQECVLALSEKAILDLFYFRRGVATRAEIEEMRFQNLDRLDPDRLNSFAQRANMHKLAQSAARFLDYRNALLQEYGLT